MAVATLANFRWMVFSDPIALHKFITSDDSPVAEIVSILTDSSGCIMLFYMMVP